MRIHPLFCISQYGNTALHIAAYGGHEEVVAALLQHDDTDVNVVNDVRNSMKRSFTALVSHASIVLRHFSSNERRCLLHALSKNETVHIHLFGIMQTCGGMTR